MNRSLGMIIAAALAVTAVLGLGTNHPEGAALR